MLGWLRHALAPHAIITSEPYAHGREWVYFFGNDEGFAFRAFRTEEEAVSHRKLLLTAFSIAPEISIEQFVITPASARSITTNERYFELLRSLRSDRGSQ
jgi:hypothetical protein